MIVLYSANPVNKPLFPAVTQFTKPLKIKQCQDYVKKSLSNLPNDFIPVTSSQSMKSAQKSEVISTLRMHSSRHGFPKISQRSLVLGERRGNHCIRKGCMYADHKKCRKKFASKHFLQKISSCEFGCVKNSNFYFFNIRTFWLQTSGRLLKTYQSALMITSHVWLHIHWISW